MRHLLGLFVTLSFLCCQPVSAAPGAEALLKKATLDLAEVKDIQFKATRLTTRGNASLREQWKMTFRQPGDFRLDFLSPAPRVIAADGQELLEYLPQAKKAVRSTFRSDAFLEAKKRILGRVSILGSRLGSVSEILERFDFEVLAIGKSYRLEGRSKNTKEKMTLWVGPEGLEKGELYDAQNRLVMRQTARDFRTFGKASLAMETRTEVFLPEPLDLEIRLRDVKINDGVAAEALRFIPPPDTRITEKTL